MPSFQFLDETLSLSLSHMNPPGFLDFTEKWVRLSLVSPATSLADTRDKRLLHANLPG